MQRIINNKNHYGNFTIKCEMRREAQSNERVTGGGSGGSGSGGGATTLSTDHPFL